ncbi:MAG: phenylacetate--CoA ligase [Verrucomicrobia bacterium]|nr:phenylacetate--CoA ligase [Verrucomicrobiota bacterium]
MARKPVIENRIWQKEETLPRDELRALQLKRLRSMVAHVSNVPFYKEKFKEDRITPDSILSLDDLRRLPFTTKADLRNNYPLGFLAVPREQVARYHGSSGTTGKPTFVAYTRDDLVTWSDLCARFLVGGGLRPEHTVQISFGYGLFTGGFGLHYGVERVGAAIVPIASGNTDRQIMIMQDMQTEVLICTPSYGVRIAEVIKAMGIPRASLALKFAHFGAEPWTEDMREHIEKELDILAFDNYGLSEVIGPGVAGECCYRQGMHIAEDHFIVECINPDTLRPVREGERGELVFTALTKQAFPLIRYRTRDISTLMPGSCPCGRTGTRMTRVTGRSDDMLIIRGVNVFPSQVEEALLRVEGTAPHYLIEVNRPGALDETTVHVEIRQENFSDKMSSMQALRDRIQGAIQAITGIHMNVNLVQPQALERSQGKAKRVLDHRRKE